MRFMKRLLVGIGAVALAGTLLTLVAPKAVHAAVAALVEVANTPANPVPNADVNAPGEEPFQTQLCYSLLTFGGGPDPCIGGFPKFFTVPTTTSDGLSIKRLVVDHLAASCNETEVITSLITAVDFGMNENQVNGSVYVGRIYIPLTPTPGTVGGVSPVGSIAARAYADPGTVVSPYLQFTSGAPLPSAYCNYTVVGHYV